MRNRAGIILWCKSKRKLLLIRRIKNNKTYWVVPGGGVETGESFETAARREVYEEIGFISDNIEEFVTIYVEDACEKYFLATVDDTFEFVIQGEEAGRCNELNQYIPEWISIDELGSIKLLPFQLKEHCYEHFI